MFDKLEIKETANAIYNLLESYGALSVTELQTILSHISRKLVIDSINSMLKEQPPLIRISTYDRFKFELNNNL